MADAVNVLVPLFAFMLIPLWIPAVAIVVGSILDVVKPRPEHRSFAERHPRQHAPVRVQPAPDAT